MLIIQIFLLVWFKNMATSLM